METDSPWCEFLFPKSNAKWNRENRHVRCLWHWEILRGTADHLSIIKDFSFNYHVVAINTKSASSLIFVFIEEPFTCDHNISETAVWTRSWSNFLNSIRFVHKRWILSCNPWVTIQREFKRKTFILIYKAHLFDNASDVSITSYDTLADGTVWASNSATKLDTWEIVSKVITREINLSFSFIWSNRWSRRVYRNLLVVVEITKVCPRTIKSDSKLHSSNDVRVFVRQAHWAHDVILWNASRCNICVIDLTNYLRTWVESSSSYSNVSV